MTALLIPKSSQWPETDREFELGGLNQGPLNHSVKFHDRDEDLHHLIESTAIPKIILGIHDYPNVIAS